MNENEEINKYKDIMELPHHKSERHPHMSMHDRAAQFSPFAALTGYEEAIVEAGRITDKRIELDDEEKNKLDIKLQIVKENIQKTPAISVTYFVSDSSKDGGAYVTLKGNVKKIDSYSKCICFTDGSIVEFNDVVNMEIEL